MLQAQLFSQARPAQHVLPVRRSSCSRVVCQGFKRGMQQTSSAPASTTATASSPPEGEAQVSIAVPIEQAPAAKQQSQSGFGMAWILVAAAVAAGLVFKKLKSNDPSQGECAGNWQHARLHVHCVAGSSHLRACLTAPCTVAVLPNCNATHCGWCTVLTSLLGSCVCRVHAQHPGHGDGIPGPRDHCSSTSTAQQGKVCTQLKTSMQADTRQ